MWNESAASGVSIVLWVGLSFALVSEIVKSAEKSAPKLSKIKANITNIICPVSWATLKPVILSALLPLVALLILQSYQPGSSAGWYALGGFILSGALTLLLRSKRLSGLLLLTTGVLFFTLNPDLSLNNASLSTGLASNIFGFIGGLLTLVASLALAHYQDWDNTEDLNKTDETTAWADATLVVAPTAFWLLSKTWLSSALESQPLEPIISIGIGVILILTTMLAWMPVVSFSQRLKPFILALSVGLGFWLVSDTMLHQTGWINWAWLLAGSVLLGQWFSGGLDASKEIISDGDNDISKKPGFRFCGRSIIHLLLLGIAVLVASRLFGTLGWIVLGLAMTLGGNVAAENNPAPAAKNNATNDEEMRCAPLPATHYGFIVAVGFLLGWVILQQFLYLHNSNVTGVNLLHPYVNAALYGGILLMLSTPMLAGIPRLLRLAAYGIILLGVSYFLHIEPLGSFLIATLSAAAIMALVFSSSNKNFTALLPMITAWMAALALMSAPVLEWGTGSDKTQKIIVLLSLALVIMLLGCLSRMIEKRQSKEISSQPS